MAILRRNGAGFLINMERRKFIRISTGIVGLGALGIGCRENPIPNCQVLDSSSAIGHRIRESMPLEPGSTEDVDCVVIGGGISGLSTAYHLQKNGIQNWVLLELEEQVGGNSGSGENSFSGYPWGAHYVPIPNNDLTDYLSFLEEKGVITGWDKNGLPVYEESFLCFDPQERLFINGNWQDGLVPQRGVPNKEQDEIGQFLHKMQEFKEARGIDDKDAFALPVDHSSTDPAWTCLDNINMKEWLLQNGFTSQYLHEFVNYCCRDDFGTPHHLTSAWAGIHYFACRKGKSANADSSEVLTWPEGNGFLVKKLRQSLPSTIRANSLVLKVRPLQQGWEIIYMEVKTGLQKSIHCRQVVMAIPQFIAARLLSDDNRLSLVKQHYQYSPWMVANLMVKLPVDKDPLGICWDNVIHGSDSLGYVNAGHQKIDSGKKVANITYYHPLTILDPTEERKKAEKRGPKEWLSIIENELAPAHPNFRRNIIECKIKIWGHAMLQPRPGIIHGGIRQKLKGLDPKNGLYFAHTDMAGISLFEEAFYQGLNAAKQVISHL